MASSDNSIQEKAKEKLGVKLNIIRGQSPNASELTHSPGTPIVSKKRELEKEKNEGVHFPRPAPQKNPPAADISQGLFPLTTCPAALFHHSSNSSPVRSPGVENANSSELKK